MTGSTRRTTALLAMAAAGSVVAAAVFDELTRNPVTGRLPVPECVVAVAVLVLIGVATAVAVHRGVPVPAAILVVPVTTGVTTVAATYVALLLGESDGQAGLVVVVAIVLTLFLVPMVGAVAGLTLAIGSAGERRRALR